MHGTVDNHFDINIQFGSDLIKLFLYKPCNMVTYNYHMVVKASSSARATAALQSTATYLSASHC